MMKNERLAPTTPQLNPSLGIKIPGNSSNELQQDDKGAKYFVKKPKLRKIQDIFKSDKAFINLLQHRKTLIKDAEFCPFTGQPTHETFTYLQTFPPEIISQYNDVQLKIEKYVRHVREVMLSNTILELLGSRISAAIMGNLLIVPRNKLSMSNNTPLTISPAVENFNEFLAKHPLLAVAEKPEYWLDNEAPSFKALNLKTEEAEIIGQAYFVALLIGHNDMVNNINLSNFGYVEDADGSLTLCVVDFGNALGIGFSGLTAEESSFLNPQFIDKTDDSFVSQPADILGFKHTMPFDEVVFPLLPRQVVPDLFNLTSSDVPSLRQAQRNGFYQACEQAVSMLEKIHEITRTIFYNTLYGEIPLDELIIKRLFPESIYPTPSTIVENGSYNIPDILEGRIKSLQQMAKFLKNGTSLTQITEQRFDYIKSKQTFFSRTEAKGSQVAARVPSDLPPTLSAGSHF